MNFAEENCQIYRIQVHLPFTTKGIQKRILENCRSLQKNLSIAWISYKMLLIANLKSEFLVLNIL